jgi:hypothetical protein
MGGLLRVGSISAMHKHRSIASQPGPVARRSAKCVSGATNGGTDASNRAACGVAGIARAGRRITPSPLGHPVGCPSELSIGQSPEGALQPVGTGGYLPPRWAERALHLMVYAARERSRGLWRPRRFRLAIAKHLGQPHSVPPEVERRGYVRHGAPSSRPETLEARACPSLPRTSGPDAATRPPLGGALRTCGAGFQPTHSHGFIVMRAATRGSSPSAARGEGSAPPPTRGAWPRSPPISPTGCSPRLPVRQWVLLVPKRLRPYLDGDSTVASSPRPAGPRRVTSCSTSPPTTLRAVPSIPSRPSPSLPSTSTSRVLSSSSTSHCQTRSTADRTTHILI